MLTVHHLGHSQSERIGWLCEELNLDYRLVKYDRAPITRMSPPALRALHPLGAAPLIEVDGRWLAESAAIVEFILARYGEGRLRYGQEHPDFTDYLYWFHFANGNLQPTMVRAMSLARCGLALDHPMLSDTRKRQNLVLLMIEDRLRDTEYLAGRDFTAADIMTVFSLTTMRLFHPVDLAPYASIRAYLQRIGARPGYQRAMAKGDPEMAPLLT